MALDPRPGGLSAVVPFLRVANMERSVPYYVDQLGFAIRHEWVDGGRLRWCWLERGPVAVMLQEFSKQHRPESTVGVGVSLVFICDDALDVYRDFIARGLPCSEPFVSNSMWFFSLTDPDGYRLEFESPTDVPEETKLSQVTDG